MANDGQAMRQFLRGSTAYPMLAAAPLHTTGTFAPPTRMPPVPPPANPRFLGGALHPGPQFLGTAIHPPPMPMPQLPPQAAKDASQLGWRARQQRHQDYVTQLAAALQGQAQQAQPLQPGSAQFDELIAALQAAFAGKPHPNLPEF